MALMNESLVRSMALKVYFIFISQQMLFDMDFGAALLPFVDFFSLFIPCFICLLGLKGVLLLMKQNGGLFEVYRF